MDELRVRIEGKEHVLNVKELSHGKLQVQFKGETYNVETVEELPFLAKKKAHKVSKGIVTAPLPGVVTSVKVKQGENVDKGKVLSTIVSMKMENEIIAPKAGIIKNVRVRKDQNVKKEDVLFIIE